MVFEMSIDNINLRQSRAYPASDNKPKDPTVKLKASTEKRRGTCLSKLEKVFAIGR